MENSGVKHRLPGIAFDIDGVFYTGSQLVGNSDKVIRSILKPYHDSTVQMPFCFLTNSGGLIEEEKAEYMNYRLGLSNEESDNKIQGKHIIQCHTPLRDPSLMREF